MSFLIDTDVLSLLERRSCPHKLTAWVKTNEPAIFISVVSIAEIEFGIAHAPVTHQPDLRRWLNRVRINFASAIEPLNEPVLVRWKELLAHLKTKNRTLTCEDSLIAATALLLGHKVVTRNSRHFAPAGVQIVDPLT